MIEQFEAIENALRLTDRATDVHIKARAALAELRTEHVRLTQERDELKYRLQTWDDVHADHLSAPASEAPKEQG
jgi:hypothetical protein